MFVRVLLWMLALRELVRGPVYYTRGGLELFFGVCAVALVGTVQ